MKSVIESKKFVHIALELGSEKVLQILPKKLFLDPEIYDKYYGKEKWLTICFPCF